jgi:ABC-2 type transport system ATP-binding protein
MNVTIFLTTHYMEEADQLADRVAIIDLGKIITSGTPDELKRSLGGDVVTLSPCVVKTEECQEFLQRTKSVLSNKPFVVGMKEADTTLAVYVQNGESAAPNIMRLLDSEGIEVQTLSVSRPSLNDVFLKYTGRNIRPQEGAPTTYTEVARKRSRRQ